jgi:hypothetical protein
MHHRTRGPRAAIALVALVFASLLVVACGSSSGSGTTSDPNTLLKQTFSGSHKISSGNLSVALTIDPSGSSTLSGPISLTFGGPFQSAGSGKLPQSNFSVSVSALGQKGSLGLLSTGTNGYITLSGTSYQLPKSNFQKLESSVSQLGTSNGASNGGLSQLGIKPLDWLQNPKIVGTESVGGTDTTHIHAGVNVAGLLNDLNTLVKKASTLGVTGTSAASQGLSAATRQNVAAAVKNATFDVWTGNSDKIWRKIQVGLTIPVTGSLSTQLGGIRSADIGLTVSYSDVNQPQTITAPKAVRPYSEFASKVQSFMQSIQGSLGGGALPGTSSGSTGSAKGSSKASSAVARYSRCITAAGTDVQKMQRCASLLNTK